VISWCNLIWLDHHKTSYEEMMAYPYNSVINTKGRCINSSQPDQRLAGCELTWDFFNPDAAMPMLVARLGAYDTWRYTENPDQSYQDRVLNLQEGCCGLPKGGDIADPSALAAWMDLLYDPDNSKLEDITQNGAEYREKTAKRNAAICSKQAFETPFVGYRAIAVNNTIYSSQLFLSVYDKTKHDLMVVFSYLKEGYWKLSLYSENPAIDCGAICKELSMLDPNPPTESKGGGHVGAGGFQVSWGYLTTLFKGGVK
jgi:oligoribonuclease NrnB/cAMP/cGMP phosphodiesterase (DHH superfamily)